jgi:2-oxoisovalerate dehydrogenase E1 component beta subunit
VTGVATLTFVEAIRRALREEMAADPSVFLIGEDIGTYGGAFRVTEGLLAEFGPDRVLDSPLAEEGLAGVAIGAALMGMRPVAELQFIDFIACAFDQITNYAAKARYRFGVGVPVVFRGPCGGGVHGGPFHSQNPESSFLGIPGLKIVEPSTCRDALGLLKSAIRDPDPVLFLEHKFLYRRIREELPDDEEILVPIGKARIALEGKDLTILTYGAMVGVALEAARDLAAGGASIEVVDLRTLAPLDVPSILASVAKTGKVIILHEATRTGGPAGELAALIAERAFEYLDGPVVRVTAPDTPVPYAPPLEAAFLPDVAKVAAAARKLLRW